jgi:hypothetical protein
MKLLQITNVDFDVIDQRLIKSFISGKCRRKKWEHNGTVYQLITDFKKTYDSFGKEVLYNVLTESGLPRKLVGLIKMCLNKTYSTVCIGKYLCEIFPNQNGLKQGDALSPLLFNFAMDSAIRRFQLNQ